MKINPSKSYAVIGILASSIYSCVLIYDFAVSRGGSASFFSFLRLVIVAFLLVAVLYMFTCISIFDGKKYGLLFNLFPVAYAVLFFILQFFVLLQKYLLSSKGLADLLLTPGMAGGYISALLIVVNLVCFCVQSVRERRKYTR